MKNLITLLFTVAFLISCNSQKKTIETQESTPITTEVETPPVVKEEMAKQEPLQIKEVKKPAPNEIKPFVKAKEPKKMTEDKMVVKEEMVKEVATVMNKEVFNHNLFDEILKKYVTADGRVNYAGIKDERKKLNTYISSYKTITPDDSWTKDDRFAYYMNAYNAMTIDLIIRNYPTESIKDIKDPWGQRYWQIGKKWVNLNEIEHEILRKMNDPRIHFGINCASFSCPPLLNAAFTSDKVDAQLEQLAKQFINDSQRNSITAERIEISNIFKWFKKDFTKNGKLIDFINKYSDVKINSNARVRYMTYNWNLNK